MQGGIIYRIGAVVGGQSFEHSQKRWDRKLIDFMDGKAKWILSSAEILAMQFCIDDLSEIKDDRVYIGSAKLI